MTEFWKDIPEYKGLYQASSIGRIRRLDRKIINHGTLSVRRGAIICQSKSKKGYIRVRLFFNGGTKEELVHRLIAKTFIPNINNLPQINHISEIKTDNRIENLEWCDSKYNNTYGSRIEKSIKSQSIEVLQINKNGNINNIFSSINEAGRITKISAGHICLVCKGKRHTAGGFGWRYRYI